MLAAIGWLLRLVTIEHNLNLPVVLAFGRTVPGTSRAVYHKNSLFKQQCFR